ncbi:hypothetical protein [Streptomyces sp. VRA16 Mangrove soil]|uniref:hypothetical protein n=1 Tax=Streptomyces sp. VRA16 Mangrove soil TaxID=2817434 RepID=UPI001A9CC465|nr:hypothetical protein [Streptomyces sp. VRA16 Mangrove soil]MBO1331961.1 hypothetical protein [Streptomyces sp. VRA16 Mangrove soil]
MRRRFTSGVAAVLAAVTADRRMVVFGSTGCTNPKKRDLDAFRVLRGTDAGRAYQRHFTLDDLGRGRRSGHSLRTA